MPYRRVEFAQGEYYHVYNRGSGRRPLFVEDDNYLFVLRLIGRYARALDVAVIAYCLMPNQTHLMLRQDGHERAGLLSQRVFNSYTKAFNKRYGRSGTLFEGRYKAIHVDRHAYLAHLCRTIHANPVKDGLVPRLEEWPYSSYCEWVGERDGRLHDRAFATAMFGDSEAYRQFVLDYFAGADRPPDGVDRYLLD